MVTSSERMGRSLRKIAGKVSGIQSLYTTCLWVCVRYVWGGTRSVLGFCERERKRVER